MSKFSGVPLLLAVISVPALAAVTVESATGDWSKLPVLSQRGYGHFNEKMQAKLFEIAEGKQCPAFQLTQGRLDFRMVFATQYAPDGTLSRLIMPKLNCPEAESVAGGAVLEMLQAGDYAPTGKSRNGWYQGEIGFSFAGDQARNPAVVQASNPQTQKLVNSTADPNEIVCEKIHVIGSRLETNRVCMTRAQWKEQERLNRDEVNRVQTQRGCNSVISC
jgi:hypothetical protein